MMRLIVKLIRTIASLFYLRQQLAHESTGNHQLQQDHLTKCHADSVTLHCAAASDHFLLFGVY